MQYRNAYCLHVCLKYRYTATVINCKNFSTYQYIKLYVRPYDCLLVCSSVHPSVYWSLYTSIHISLFYFFSCGVVCFMIIIINASNFILKWRKNMVSLQLFSINEEVEFHVQTSYFYEFRLNVFSYIYLFMYSSSFKPA